MEHTKKMSENNLLFFFKSMKNEFDINSTFLFPKDTDVVKIRLLFSPKSPNPHI